MARRFRMQFQDVRPSIRATRPVTQVPRFSALFSRVPIEQAGERPSRRKLRVLESSLLPGCERRSPLAQPPKSSGFARRDFEQERVCCGQREASRRAAARGGATRPPTSSRRFGHQQQRVAV